MTIVRSDRRCLTIVVPGTSLRDVMTQRMDLRVALRLVMALLIVTAFGTGLVSVCLPEDLHHPAYYDGDGDDVGIAQERQTLASDIAVVQTIVQLAPMRPSLREVAQSSGVGAHVSTPRSSESRAPPA
jgi:hypothetical protein